MIEENSGQAKSVPLSEVSHLVSVPFSKVLLYWDMHVSRVENSASCETDLLGFTFYRGHATWLAPIYQNVYTCGCAVAMDSICVTLPRRATWLSAWLPSHRILEGLSRQGGIV